MSRIAYMIILLTTSMMVAGCTRGRPSEDPPIHPNPNMDDQPKYEALEKSEFFVDGLTMRQPVDGTVARNELREDDVYFRGKNPDGSLVERMPVRIDMDLLRRGQERYNIYCAPCHALTGAGQGIVVKKGYLPPPSIHIDRLRGSPDGHFYDVITNGIRNMPAYKHQIPVADRWAIVSYIRALQRSQHADLEDVPAEKRNEIN